METGGASMAANAPLVSIPGTQKTPLYAVRNWNGISLIIPGEIGIVEKISHQ